MADSAPVIFSVKKIGHHANDNITWGCNGCKRTFTGRGGSKGDAALARKVHLQLGGGTPLMTKCPCLNTSGFQKEGKGYGVNASQISTSKCTRRVFSCVRLSLRRRSSRLDPQRLTPNRATCIACLLSVLHVEVLLQMGLQSLGVMPALTSGTNQSPIRV